MKLYSDLLRAFARATLSSEVFLRRQDDIEAFLTTLRERGGDSELTDAQLVDLLARSQPSWTSVELGYRR